MQAALKADGIDGWLLYDFRGLNPIAADVTARRAARAVTWRRAAGTT